MACPIDDATLFAQAYGKSFTWPCSLINKDLYRPVLESASDRFEEASKRLFSIHEEPIIFFRDYNIDTGKFDKHKVCKNPDREKDVDPDQQLRDYLGDSSSWDASSSSLRGDVLTRMDPPCRFIFLIGGHSRKELLITSSMFKRLMTYHQVTHAYVDYVTVFGRGDRPRDLRFGGFSHETYLGNPSLAAKLPIAGRSGWQYQLCYNLKAPVRLADGQWSIQQAAVHHQFDVVNGRALWIIIKGNDELKRKIERLTGYAGPAESRTFDNPTTCFQATLAVHLMLVLWSTEPWRGHIEHFETQLGDETDSAIYAPRDPGSVRHVYRPQDLQDVQNYQEKVKESIIVMELNIKVLQSLSAYYTSVLGSNIKSLDMVNCLLQTQKFSIQVGKFVGGLEVHIARARLLSDIMEARKVLIIQHMQAQTTETMSRLAYFAGADAVVMKIITIVTLIFLPATFVSTFFSTDVVKYQPDNGGGNPVTNSENQTSFSGVALQRWLEVTIPLTVVTAGVAFWLYRRSIASRKLASGLNMLV